MSEPTYYDTKDFDTIVLLKHHGVKFDKVVREGTQGKTKRVYVEDTPEIQQLLLDYENGDLQVNMKDLMQTIRDTKQFVHR